MRRALERLAGLGLPVAAADGGSGESFVRFLKELGFRVAKPRKRGLVPQVKAGVALGANSLGREFLLYTEPDKLLFFEGALLDFIHQVRSGSRFGMALAARDEAGFASFPEWQQFTESSMNRVTADWTGQPGDYCYGPLLFRAADADRVRHAPDELGWGWRFFLLGGLLREKRRVAPLPLAVGCPPEQQKDRRTDRQYRTRQLRQNLDGLLLGLGGV